MKDILINVGLFVISSTVVFAIYVLSVPRIFNEETVYADGYSWLNFQRVSINDSRSYVEQILGKPMLIILDGGRNTYSFELSDMSNCSAAEKVWNENANIIESIYFYSQPKNHGTYYVRAITFNRDNRVINKTQELYFD